mgnify:CR=1 FL=1
MKIITTTMVSNTDFEKQWSLALKKGKQSVAGKKNQVPLDTQKKQLAEEMSYYKTKLRQNLKDGQITDIKKTLNTLIELRGKQLSIRLQEVEKKIGMIPKEYVKYYSKKYTEDCGRLIANVQILLTKKI